MPLQLVPSLLLLATLVAGGSSMGEGSERIERNHAKIKDYNVPVFTVAELQAGSRTKDLADVLATTGLISVVGTEKDKSVFTTTRQDALLGLCGCMKWNRNDKSGFAFVEGADSSLLSDGTTRTTLATATVGSTPLPLYDDELVEAGCSSHTVQSMDTLRDQVAWVSHAFVEALDELLVATGGGHREALLEASRGNAFATVASIVKASHNLEHFHVYEKAENAGGHQVLDVHTDAGLFLTFVPGMQCDTAEVGTSGFYVQDNGVLKRAIFRDDSVGVMLGVGAENWLRATSTPLRATRHAVNMQAGQSRAWYGMSKSCGRINLVELNKSRLRILLCVPSSQCTWYPKTRSFKTFPNARSRTCAMPWF